MARLLCVLLVSLVALAAPPAGAQGAAAGDGSPWYSGERGAERIHLYFFWSKHCPHCLEARPFVERLARDYPWLAVRSLELTTQTANARLYVELAARLGQEARSVPAFLFCGDMLTGFDSAVGVGAYLEARLLSCYERVHAGAVTQGSPEPVPPVDLPLFGRVEPGAWSLPAFTLVLAGLDAFNPCAFFVLLFLLSLLVHARSRARMLLVGGIFVLFSGLVYFVFMAAWLNVFLIAGELRAVTAIAGAVAVAIASLNIKDYFWFKRGPSLSIPERAKPGLFQRMRALVGATRLPALLAGTVVLALAANTYELLCTAGFPMVFTRLLTLHALPTGSYYVYLALYNLVYVTPLAVIVVIFTATLGARKLGEEEGRILKLVSGLMMLGLGAVLLVAPQWLSNVLTAATLLIAAGGAAVVVVAIDRHRERRGRGV